MTAMRQEGPIDGRWLVLLRAVPVALLATLTYACKTATESMSIGRGLNIAVRQDLVSLQGLVVAEQGCFPGP